MMAMKDRGSIFPFLPRFSRSDSGDLHWPRELDFALKSLLRGPSSSQVHGSESLCDFINDLREQSRLPPLPTAALDGITEYFDDLITRQTAQFFFESVLPSMADLAHRLPDLLNDHFNKSMNCASIFKLVNLRVLKPQQAGLVYLSQELVAAILACAFFCLFPLKGREEAGLPNFNLSGLFRGISSMTPQQEHKVHCIMHYFDRVCQQMPQGMVSYERKVLPRHERCEVFSPISEPNESYWGSSSFPFCPLQVFENGAIEDQSVNALEVDFANRYLGGGVLGSGCVQEEIRFVISPELIAGMLFMSAMHDNEAIEIRGVERFSCYNGYATSFCFAGNYVDNKPRDFLGRRETRIVAIDALMYPREHQFEEALMVRETNKAFCGFLDHVELHATGLSSLWTEEGKSSFLELQEHSQMDASLFQDLPSDRCNDHFSPSKEGEIEENRTEKTHDITEVTSHVPVDDVQAPNERCTMGIVTGNWGCGAFGGDVELKSLLQWIAASQAGRPFLHYFTFGGSHGQTLQQVADWIINEKWFVGELWGLLVDYGEKRLRGEHNENLFKWILPHLCKADFMDVLPVDTH